jgi:hypothetical protein
MRRSVSLALLLVLAACTGATARREALWPQIKSVWPAIKVDIVHGIGDVTPSLAVSDAIRAIDSAVSADDHTRLRGVDWSLLRPMAERGVRLRVADNEISQGLAASLLERIKQFSEAMQEIGKR